MPPDIEEEIEREKLAVEREKLDVERYKAKWAAIGAIVPMAVAFGTIIFGVWSLHETAKMQFETKVAELAMVGPGPQETKNRARTLVAIFGRRLPSYLENSLNQFEPSKFGTIGVADEDAVVQSKKELFKAITEHPAARKDIIATWKALFPDDQWLKVLDARR